MQNRGLNVFLNIGRDWLFPSGFASFVSAPGRVLSLLFIVWGLPLSAQPSDSACEDGMSTPALRFTRTLRSGVTEGAVSSADLKWMIEQPAPVVPIRNTRDHKNLSHLKIFHREHSRINSEQWRLVQAAAREMQRGLVHDLGQIEKAQEATKYVWAMRPTGFAFPQGETPIGHFSSSKGDLLIVTYDQAGSYLYNFNTGSRFPLEENIGETKAFDFFETNSGDVFFALNVNNHLVVRNALTMVKVIDSKFSDGGVMRPRIYEENGTLTVITGHGSDSGSMEKTGVYPFEKVRSVPGQLQVPLERFSEFSRAVRMADGNMYVHGVIESDSGTAVQLINLTTGDVLLNVRVRAEDFKNVTFSLIANPQLTLIYHDPATLNWYQFDERKAKLKPLKYSLNEESISTLLYPNGVATAGQFSLSMDKSGRRRHHFRFTEVISNKPRLVDLNYSPHSTTHDWNLKSIRTAKRLWAYGWEHYENRHDRLHIYDFAADTVIPIPVPQSVRDAGDVVYNPKDGRILVFVSISGFRYAVYQVYGPDEREP